MKRSNSSKIVQGLETVCAVLLGLLTLIAAFELVAWLAWQGSYAAIEEIQAILVVWLGLLSAAYCLGEGLHLAVGVVTQRLPHAWQPLLDRLPGLAGATFGILMAVFGAKLIAAVDNTLPGTGWSAAIQYQPAVVAGALIAWFGLREALGASMAE